MKPLHWRVRRRRTAMMLAYLVFAAKHIQQENRETLCWSYLLHWASLGGTPEEVIA